MLAPRAKEKPDNIAAARMSCSGEAFAIPVIERSTRLAATAISSRRGPVIGIEHTQRGRLLRRHDEQA
jgi:hypothetical protein